MKKKLEYTEAQYIHHGMKESNRGRQDALRAAEATVVSMMVSAYIDGDEDRSSALRDVVKRLREQFAQDKETEAYLDKVGARLIP